MKTRILFVASLSVVALTACPPQQEVKKEKQDNLPPPPPKEKTAQETFDEGVAAFDKGDLEAAKASFTKVKEKAPTLVSAEYNLGVIAERQSDLKGAQEHYLAAHKVDPKHRPTLLNLSKVYRLQDRFEDAIKLLEEAAAEPGNEFDVALLNNLSVAYRLAKKYDKAEAAARKVLSRTKDNPDAYKNLVLIYFDQGNLRLAEFISANAKKLDEKDPGVWNNLGLIYLRMDERRQALGQFLKAVQLNEKFAPGHFNIGALALAARDYDTAEREFAKVTQADPTSYDGFLAYAWALDGQKGRDPKKGATAGAAFEKVLTLKADQPDAICGAGWAYAADKAGFDKAVPYLEKCKGLSGTSSQDQQLIDAKLKTIASIKAAPAAQPAPEQKKAPPKADAKADKVFEKATEDAAKEGGGDSSGEATQPANGGQAAGDKPADKPAEKPAEKPADKPAEKK
ncbi:MAG: tetratricopeptide repeat protein [Myxococcaceae bacterium]